MISDRKMQAIIGITLLIGTLLSAGIVLIGGIMYLLQHGSDAVPTSLLHYEPQHIQLAQIWQNAFSFSSSGIIQLGLLCLVSTQLLRVALLCWFYTMIRDYAFMIISTFILLVLIYSTVWRDGGENSPSKSQTTIGYSHPIEKH